jgi:hypothetical protein
MPEQEVGVLRASGGFLVAKEDRVGWYSAHNGIGAYVEFSPDTKVMRSYPPVPPIDSKSILEGFALTPGGRVFVTVYQLVKGGRLHALYELDRDAKTWNTVDMRRDAHGEIPWLEGNDGESLVFTGPPDKSKLQLFDVSQAMSH